MEEIWKYTKPFSYPMKGANGCVGYGYRTRKRKPNQKAQKRKIGRDIRHYSFDTSECWELYTTVMEYLSDNGGGFFRTCGNADDWYLFDAQGNPYPEKATTKEELVPFFDAEAARRKSYKKHLCAYLELNPEHYLSFLHFIIPRLIYFESHHQGYPEPFNSDEEWRLTLRQMIVDLTKGNDKLFIEYFFNLWD